jgi:hypothetical protein
MEMHSPVLQILRVLLLKVQLSCGVEHLLESEFDDKARVCT